MGRERAMTGRRRLPRGAATAAAMAMAAALTVALAQRSVQAGFVGGSTSSGNQVSAAGDFCSSPGNQTAIATADSVVSQGSPASASGGADFFLVVNAQAGSVQRIYARFDLPAIPAGCAVSGATLQIYAETEVAGRTLGAYRADPAAAVWTEAGLTWNNKPAAVGTAATIVMPNTDQYVAWSVTGLVQDLYTFGNNGFVVRDQDETGVAMQQFGSRATANQPQLKVSWN
jgi:hypothetical protein